MKLDEQPVAETVDNNKDPLAHRACMVCWPELVPGMLAYCGTKLQGIPLPEDCDKCIVCEDLKDTHFKTCPGVWKE